MQPPRVDGAAAAELPPGLPARAQKLLRQLPAAFLIALISMSYAASYGAMIFGHGGSVLLQAGLPLLFVTTCAVMLVAAWRSSLPFVVGGADSNSTGILALMVSGMWAALSEAGIPSPDALVTVLTAVA